MHLLTSFSRNTSRLILFALSLSVALGLADAAHCRKALAARDHSSERTRALKVAIAPHDALSNGPINRKRRQRFDCLPPGYRTRPLPCRFQA